MTEFINADITKKAKGQKNNTIFTHRLISSMGYSETRLEPCDFLKVVYLGKCIYDGDMFACYNTNDEIHICKGKKGDEFND